MKRIDNGRRGIFAGTVLIAGGLLLLVLQLFSGLAGTLWPVFIIAPGGVLLALSLTETWRSKELAAAGSVVAGIGLLLLVQAVFDYYRSWAYAWTLLPFFAGAGFYVFGDQENEEATRETGRRMMQGAAAAFLAFAALFELLIFDGGIVGARYILPLLLVAAGVYLVFARERARPHDTGRSTQPPTTSTPEKPADAAETASEAAGTASERTADSSAKSGGSAGSQ